MNNMVTPEHVAHAARMAIRTTNQYTWDDDVIQSAARKIACDVLETFAQMVLMTPDRLAEEERELPW